jgi:hypothetical protein
LRKKRVEDGKERGGERKSDRASGEKRREAKEEKGLDYWIMGRSWGGGLEETEFWDGT